MGYPFGDLGHIYADNLVGGEYAGAAWGADNLELYGNRESAHRADFGSPENPPGCAYQRPA